MMKFINVLSTLQPLLRPATTEVLGFFSQPHVPLQGKSALVITFKPSSFQF